MIAGLIAISCEKPDVHEGDVTTTNIILLVTGDDVFGLLEDGVSEDEIAEFGFSLIPVGGNSSVSRSQYGLNFSKVNGLTKSSRGSSLRADSPFPVEDYIIEPATVTIRRNSTGQERTINFTDTIAVPKGETFTVVGWTFDRADYDTNLGYIVADQEFTVNQTDASQHYEIKATTTYSLFTVNDVTNVTNLTVTSFSATVGGENLTTPLDPADANYYLFADGGQNATLEVNWSAQYVDSQSVTHTISGVESVNVSNTVAYEHYEYNFAIQLDENLINNIAEVDPTDITFSIILDQVFQTDGSVDLIATVSVDVNTVSTVNNEGDFAGEVGVTAKSPYSGNSDHNISVSGIHNALAYTGGSFDGSGNFSGGTLIATSVTIISGGNQVTRGIFNVTFQNQTLDETFQQTTIAFADPIDGDDFNIDSGDAVTLIFNY